MYTFAFGCSTYSGGNDGKGLIRKLDRKCAWKIWSRKASENVALHYDFLTRQREVVNCGTLLPRLSKYRSYATIPASLSYYMGEEQSNGKERKRKWNRRYWKWALILWNGRLYSRVGDFKAVHDSLLRVRRLYTGVPSTRVLCNEGSLNEILHCNES